MSDTNSNRSILALIKSKWCFFLIVLLLILAAGYLFYPRSMKSLIIKENVEIEKIVLSFHGISVQERPGEIELTLQQKEKFIKYLSKHYVRRCLFKKKHTDNGDFIGCDVFVAYKQENATDSKEVSFFTKNIISVDNVQYKMYSGSLYDEIQSLLDGITSAVKYRSFYSSKFPVTFCQKPRCSTTTPTFLADVSENLYFVKSCDI